MQAPPPARDPVPQMMAQQAHIVSQSTPSVAPSNRDIVTPSTTSPVYAKNLAVNPLLPFADIHLSPDVFSFSSHGSATAPALPDTRMFWDQGSNANNMDVGDPLGPDLHNADLLSDLQPFPELPVLIQGHLLRLPRTFGSGHQASDF